MPINSNPNKTLHLQTAQFLTKELKLLKMLVCGAVIEPNVSTCGTNNQFITVGQEYGVCDPGLKPPLLA